MSASQDIYIDYILNSWSKLESITKLSKTEILEFTDINIQILLLSYYGYIDELDNYDIEIINNTYSNKYDNLIIMACLISNIDLLKYCLDKNMNINENNKNGDSPLIWASVKGHLEIVKILLSNKNININHANIKGNTALILACIEGHIEIVELLLSDKRINVNHANINNDSALILACVEGHIEIVKLLLCIEGINVNQINILGNTALIVASSRGFLEIVKLLSSIKGISYLHKNNIKQNAQDIALLNSKFDIVEYFKVNFPFFKIKNIQNNTTEQTEQEPCCICYKNKKDIVIIPCGHISMCSLCAINLTDTKCPNCRSLIENMYKVYQN